MTDTFEGINKIAATPTWCLWSCRARVRGWMVLYVIIDVAGFRRWTIVVRPAGANPLVAYFLHPIAVELIGVLGLHRQLLGVEPIEESLATDSDVDLFGDDPASIARWLAWFDSLEPLCFTADEDAAWRAARHERRDWEKSHFDDRADQLKSLFE